MTRIIVKAVLLCTAVIGLIAFTPFASAELKAGAARIDITPAVADLPAPFVAVESNLFVRALVLDSGGTRVVLVVGDLPTIVADVFADLTQRIATAAGAPVQNVVLAVTHTHNAVRLDNNPAMGIMLPGSPKVTKITSDKIIESVQQAVANLQPAKAGFTTTVFHLAAARGNGEPPPSGQGAPAARSRPPAIDSALNIFKVESMTGEPIALLVNNGPEPVMSMGINTQVSADVAGVMERYVEQRFSDKAVVLYTVGSPPGTAINARQRIPGALPADPRVLMSAVGTILGEEVLTASSAIKTSSDLPLWGAAKVLTCAGRSITPLNEPGTCSNVPASKLPRCTFAEHDAAPVNLQIGVIRIGDFSMVHTDANIQAPVWAEVRDQAPSPEKTMLVSLVFGPMHYVVADADYSDRLAANQTTAKPGCAEKGFVDDALMMLKAASAK